MALFLLVAIYCVAWLAVIAAFALWYACARIDSQLICPCLVHAQGAGRRVALTFDDGPAPPFTNQILDVLLEKKVQATFFVCGRNAKLLPAMLRRIVAEGHQIGNHTYSHSYLYFLSRSEMAEEIDRTQEVVREVIAEAPRVFRPPYGARWFGLGGVLRERGLRAVQWSATSRDWLDEPDRIVADITKNVRSGSIILMHDCAQPSAGRFRGLWRRLPWRRALQELQDQFSLDSLGPSNALKALPAVIDEVRRRGFEFVPLSAFLD